MSNSSIYPIDRIIRCYHSGPQWTWEYGNEMGVTHIPQSFKAGALPSDGLMSYPGHLLKEVGSYPSAEMQSVYSIAPATWPENFFLNANSQGLKRQM